ncbi:hypothetical protein NOF04DRAFT_21462 [Fusarium oxysporum II5]|uniref:Uncharacterized protein n=2 Tax=Fusarium oxysporum species complex TaxID=171631 RepID=X0K477_FUSO5|nr:uncharacterized protein FOIG_06336 [Fusarium odoratissimum NRRL 54006]EXM03547.1 hypothetical protein FOIG_06336 [Fusarium odoratissimum NRRL 54006]KAK2134569.1 hypothetical protein NOF04DRAFT_21462 [Fusarium oxysporum II5]TXC10990.1 hypothetical protein FocTR4_00007571 [Fusarium oxysporum f. sp. cubense]
MMSSKTADILQIIWNANNYFKTRGRRNYTHPGAENGRLCKSEYSNVGGLTSSKCDSEWEVEREERESTDPKIHYGVITSGDSLIKDATTHDNLSEQQQFLFAEMEATRLMDKFLCLAIRGICNYAGSHKNCRGNDMRLLRLLPLLLSLSTMSRLSKSKTHEKSSRVSGQFSSRPIMELYIAYANAQLRRR